MSFSLSCTDPNMLLFAPVVYDGGHEGTHSVELAAGYSVHTLLCVQACLLTPCGHRLVTRCHCCSCVDSCDRKPPPGSQLVHVLVSSSGGLQAETAARLRPSRLALCGWGLVLRGSRSSPDV
jgi:hypothetical protein